MRDELVKLHKACVEGNLHVVESILSEDPSLGLEMVCFEDSSYYHGNSIHAAAAGGNEGVLAAIIRSFPDIINIKNRIGQAPLHIATMLGHESIIALLVKSGADIDIRNPRNASSLTMATTTGNLKIAKQLLSLGASISLVNEKGNTLLHSALAKKKCRKMLELLLENGADLFAKNNAGDDVFKLAEDLHNDEALLVLKEHVNRVSTTNKKLTDENPVERIDDLDFHRQNWLNNRCGDSLSWLYESTINGVEGLKTKDEIVALLGQPDKESDDEVWSYSADEDTGFNLHWGGPNRNELVAWKMP